jgi:YD repeat-containing protein
LNYLFDIFTPTGVTDPQGLLTTFAMEQIPGTFEIYDKRLKSVGDPSGQSLEFVYDSDGRLTQVEASDGQWVTYYPTITYSDGTSASYTYDVVTTTDPDTGDPGTPVLVWKTAQDTRAEGPMQSIQYTYRSNPPPKFGGQIVSEQHYLDPVPVSTFTSDDARTTATDARGDGPSRTLFMSKSGKTPLLRWKNDFDGVDPEYFYYNGYNYLNKFTDRRGADTLYSNEAILGRPTSITHPASFPGDGSSFTTSTEGYTYSYSGAVSTTDPYLVASVKSDNNKVTYYDRDSLNRITQIRYPDGSTEAFTYDSKSRVLSHKRKNGWYEFADYDTTGKMTTLWNPANSAANPQTQEKTIFTYYIAPNAWAGRVKDVTDPLGHKTTYEYDLSFDSNGNQTTTPCSGRGLVTKITHNVDGSYKSFGYDKFGNRLSERDETGRTTTFTYDDYKRLTSVALPGQTPTFYDYTASSGASSYSHTSNAIRYEDSPSGVETERTYDANQRKVSETQANGVAGVEATTQFGYDENGNLTSVTDPRYVAGYPGDYTTLTTYDSRNRKISVTTPGPLNYETGWQNDPVGNVTRITRPDGGVETKTYDSMNRVLSDTMPKAPGHF